MFYYKKTNNKYKTGKGLLDSIINAVTSQTVKNVVSDASKKVATQALQEVGTRASQKVINKILPRKGSGLNEKSKDILNKYAIPIQDYVKNKI